METNSLRKIAFKLAGVIVLIIVAFWIYDSCSTNNHVEPKKTENNIQEKLKKAETTINKQKDKKTLTDEETTELKEAFKVVADETEKETAKIASLEKEEADIEKQLQNKDLSEDEKSQFQDRKEEIRQVKNKSVARLKKLSSLLKSIAFVCAATGVGAKIGIACEAAAFLIDLMIAGEEEYKTVKVRNGENPYNPNESGTMDITKTETTDQERLQESREKITGQNQTVIPSDNSFGDYSISIENSEMLRIWHFEVLKKEYLLTSKNGDVPQFLPVKVSELKKKFDKSKELYTIIYVTNTGATIVLADDSDGDWSLNPAK